MITLTTDRPITVDQFIAVLRRSTLGERRPIDDRDIMTAMLAHGNLLATAWDGERLIGVARTLTDFLYIGYLSDLAVDATYQRQGIGRRLIEATRARMGPRSRLLLLAAPAATDYYPRLGFRAQPQAWIIAHHEPLE